jgi:hypothetical protein
MKCPLLLVLPLINAGPLVSVENNAIFAYLFTYGQNEYQQVEAGLIAYL